MSTTTDISILSFDVSHNCLGRAHMLAEVLGRNFTVEIVGPAAGDDIWLPLRRTGVPIHWTPQGHVTGPALVRRLLAMVRGRSIYAIKPRFTSFGLGLIARKKLGLPLIVDIDDWELGFYLQDLKASLTHDFRHPGNFNNFLTTVALEGMTSWAEAVTVSSSFLHRRFGGITVPHCRDTDVLDPERFEREAIRRQLGWQKDVVVLFMGTPGIHKGLDVLLEAGRVIGVDGIRLVIAGVPEGDRLWSLNGIDISERDAAADGRQAGQGSRVEIIGQRDSGQIAPLLAAADIVAVPQLEGPATAGQVPAKLVDAMAMGKAIAASAVSDIPAMLEGCGMLCRPGDADDLAARIRVLASNHGLRERLGAEARARCIERYSYNAIEKKLASLFIRVAGLNMRAD